MTNKKHNNTKKDEKILLLNNEVKKCSQGLPQEWRGRTLFLSPWAFIYAKNEESAEEAYDELEDLAAEYNHNSDKPSGIVILTGNEDSQDALVFDELKKIYQATFEEEALIEEEKVIFEKELGRIEKLQKFKEKISQKGSQGFTEKQFITVQKRIDSTFKKASVFIQPEILSRLMNSNIDEAIYWSAFLASEDAIKENVDELISTVMAEKGTSIVVRGLVWTVLGPGIYSGKKKLVEKTRESFSKGFEENVLLKKGKVTLTDLASEE